MNKFGVIFILHLAFVTGCADEITNSDKAIKVAITEMTTVAISDGFNVADMQMVSVRENQEIDGWEVYYEDSNRGYRLNVLVARNGSTEVHKLKINSATAK